MGGLIRIVQVGSALHARFSHPLYGDVVRRRLGTVSARRLRGRIVTALRGQPLDSAAARLRMAQLSIESDQPVDTDLLIAATKDAIFLSNVPLGEHLAQAAFERDGGLQAAALLSRALLWQGRPKQADEVLARFSPDDLDELQLLMWGVPRLSILFWSLGDVERAHEVLALLRERVEHPNLRLIVEATGSAIAVHQNEIAEGIAAAQAVLSDPHAPKHAVEFAAFAAGLAMPVAGRGSDFEPIAARCRSEQKATDGMIRVMVRYGDVLALTHIGELDRAEQRAVEYTQFSSAGQFLGWAIAKITTGLVATHRGRFPEAISAFEQALAALAAEASLPWLLPPRVLLARCYAVLGSIDQSERVLADAKEHSGQFMALHDPELLISKAWGRGQGWGAAGYGAGACGRRLRAAVRAIRRRGRGFAPCGKIRRPHGRRPAVRASRSGGRRRGGSLRAPRRRRCRRRRAGAGCGQCRVRSLRTPVVRGGLGCAGGTAARAQRRTNQVGAIGLSRTASGDAMRRSGDSSDQICGTTASAVFP